jgi:hypothetical protein
MLEYCKINPSTFPGLKTGVGLRVDTESGAFFLRLKGRA